MDVNVVWGTSFKEILMKAKNYTQNYSEVQFKITDNGSALMQGYDINC